MLEVDMKPIEEAAKNLVTELAKTYPKIIEQKYDNHGSPTTEDDSVDFYHRMRLGIYIELLKGGIFSMEQK